MTIFQNDIYFIFRSEVKRNRGISGVLLISTILLVLLFLIYYNNEWFRLASMGAEPLHFSRQWAINISSIETVFIVLIAPLLGISGQLDILTNSASELFLLAPHSSRFYLVRWLFSFLFILFLISFFSVIYIYLIRMGLPVSNAVASSVSILSIGLALSSIGFCMVRLFRSVAVTLFLSYTLVFFLFGQVLLAGPFIDRFSNPGSFIHLLMITNGYIGITSSFGADIMRRGWLYEVSPIGMYRFDYPEWYSVSMFYVGIAVLCLLIGLRGRRRVTT